MCELCERNIYCHGRNFFVFSVAGPVKISDNNIENIFNINININGIFTNNIEQDIINVVVGLLNQQGIAVGGATLKEKLMALAEKSGSKNLDVNIPASVLGQKFKFDGLASTVREALTKKTDNSENVEPQTGAVKSNLESQAKDVFLKYLNESQGSSSE